MNYFLSVMAGIGLIFCMVCVRHTTHSQPNPIKSNLMQDAPLKIIPSPLQPDCYSKENVQLVAISASEHTVDIVVDKMLKEKFIIVNKDGFSYRFKMVKKYKTPIAKK